MLRALCMTVGALGDRSAAAEYCPAAIEHAPPDQFQLNYSRLEAAQGLALAGDVEGALSMLEDMLDNPSRPSAKALRLDRALRVLHDDARFELLMARLEEDREG